MRQRQWIAAALAAIAMANSGNTRAGQAAPAAPQASAATLYSPDTDPMFAQPYVDVDEWRETPVRHRYVHGGFTGTQTRFSFYFPPTDQYRGRFFQHITPVPDNENLAQKLPAGPDNKIGFAIASGAYFVETNGGGKLDLGRLAVTPFDSTISAYRANAASAAFSRVVARRIYGTSKRPFGYAYGGSGGAFRTIGSFENTTGVWDGVVPYVMGSNMAIPNMFTFRIRAMRILGDKLDAVVDAASPGGSGDIYAGLSPLQQEALREATRMGFPPQAWYLWRAMGIHGLAPLYPGVLMADSGYFSDFWSKPGYLGFDHPEQFEGARLRHASTVSGVVTAAEAARAHINTDTGREGQRGGVDTAFKVPEGAEGERVVGFRLATMPPKMPFLGGDLVVNSGAAKGRRLPLARIVGDVVVLGVADASAAALIKPGDEVLADNSNFLALETYHRHQVPDASYKAWDQFRKPDGTALYPQRPRLIGPGFVKMAGGSVLGGQWTGKMIVVESLWDREALAWQADWYRALVRQQQGPGAERNFRVYMNDHAVHGDFNPRVMGEDPTRVISYLPVLQQALRDVADWVEKGRVPAASTAYRIVDGQTVVPASAALRHGLQPVVSLRVRGGGRVVIHAGESVRFDGTIAVPPGGGSVVAAAWDFDGKGDFASTSPVRPGSRVAQVAIAHRFDTPGTWFVALKGVAQRHGEDHTPYARLENLDRVRVVVR